MRNSRAFWYSAGVIPSLRADDAEADAVGVGVGRHLMAVRRAHHRDFIGHPGRAADDAETARRGSLRILRIPLSVVLRAVPVGHPFPDVADDVAETVPVRRI